MVNAFAGTALFDVGQSGCCQRQRFVRLFGGCQRAQLDRWQTTAVAVVRCHRHLVHDERAQILNDGRILREFYLRKTSTL